MSTKQDTVAQLVKPSYNPTSEELNQAISAALKQEVSSKSFGVTRDLTTKNSTRLVVHFLRGSSQKSSSSHLALFLMIMICM